jgi:hypothetical protein
MRRSVMSSGREQTSARLQLGQQRPLATAHSGRQERLLCSGTGHLHGTPGAIAVLHTHARGLHFHPHVHLVIPGAALDGDRRLWRTLPGKAKYLFDHKALAKVFRGKFMAALHEQGLVVQKWPRKSEQRDKWKLRARCRLLAAGDRSFRW